jgi:cation diffusion facilitator family transporter
MRIYDNPTFTICHYRACRFFSAPLPCPVSACRNRPYSRPSPGVTDERQGPAAELRSEETHSAALSSVVAACFLTALKIVVGVVTGSLGVLAEAAHSGLDLVAAIITYIAVRAASKPPDREHLYGHGKTENLSALVETLLLFLTCGWIIFEAVKRLLSGNTHVNASWWAFAVLVISIVIDYSRSRMLYQVAARHRSQALEADALHFSTDVWSSLVVILGLIGVKLAERFPGLQFLKSGDAVAALFVAGIVLVVSARLGWRTIEALLDASPAGAVEKIKARVETLPEVLDCHAIRVRHSGPKFFVDLHITLDGGISLAAAHSVSDQVEQAVAEILPEADVTVHPEPAAPPDPPSKAVG